MKIELLMSPMEQEPLRLAAIAEHLLGDRSTRIIDGLGLIRLTPEEHGRPAIQVWHKDGSVLCVEGQLDVVIFKPGAWVEQLEALASAEDPTQYILHLALRLLSALPPLAHFDGLDGELRKVISAIVPEGEGDVAY